MAQVQLSDNLTRFLLPSAFASFQLTIRAFRNFSIEEIKCWEVIRIGLCDAFADVSDRAKYECWQRGFPDASNTAECQCRSAEWPPSSGPCVRGLRTTKLKTRKRTRWGGDKRSRIPPECAFDCDEAAAWVTPHTQDRTDCP